MYYFNKYLCRGVDKGGAGAGGAGAGGGGGGGASPPTILWGWHFSNKEIINSNKEIIKIFSSNIRSSNPQKHSLKVFWEKRYF